MRIDVHFSGNPSAHGELHERVVLVVDVLRIVDGRIAEINAFVGAHHVTALGLRATLAP